MEKEVLTRKVNDWIACLVMNPDHDPLIKELIQTIETYKIPLELFHNFARSMLFDIDHNGFSTLEEFLEYAEGASVAPASVFVHLCCLKEENGEFSAPDVDVIAAARPCAIFSYIVHIIRDFQDDQQHNLNYFALDILEKYNLNPDDLKLIANGGTLAPSFRNVVREYLELARKYEEETLQEIEKLSKILNGRNLFSLHVIYHLYKQVYKRIDVEHGNFTSVELNPTPRENREAVLDLASEWT
jgi:phytoene/squalene synthetase